MLDAMIRARESWHPAYRARHARSPWCNAEAIGLDEQITEYGIVDRRARAISQRADRQAQAPAQQLSCPVSPDAGRHGSGDDHQRAAIAGTTDFAGEDRRGGGP